MNTQPTTDMSSNDSTEGTWPSLPYEAWMETRHTLHLWMQIVGKVKPAPAFYSYTSPEPPGLKTATLRPAAAFYSHELGEFLLNYDDVRKAVSPEQALLNFFQSAYEAGVTLDHWDREALERH